MQMTTMTNDERHVYNDHEGVEVNEALMNAKRSSTFQGVSLADRLFLYYRMLCANPEG